mgnify:CR=1 FL=1
MTMFFLFFYKDDDDDCVQHKSLDKVMIIFKKKVGHFHSIYGFLLYILEII